MEARGKADEFLDDAVDFVQTRGGERITGINGTTREVVLAAVRDTIEAAVREGLDPYEAADRLSDRIGDLSIWSDARSDLVARTETMFAYNDAALSSYRKLDVEEVVAFDGDYDPVCEQRNGQTFTIDDALSISDHPNGTLDWAPKAKVSRMSRVQRKASPDYSSVVVPQVTINVPEQLPMPAPIVNVAPAEVHVDALPFTAAIDALRTYLTATKSGRRRIERDEQGRITAVVEE